MGSQVSTGRLTEIDLPRCVELHKGILLLSDFKFEGVRSEGKDVVSNRNGDEGSKESEQGKEERLGV